VTNITRNENTFLLFIKKCSFSSFRFHFIVHKDELFSKELILVCFDESERKFFYSTERKGVSGFSAPFSLVSILSSNQLVLFDG